MKILLLFLFTTQTLFAVEPVAKPSFPSEEQQQMPVDKSVQQPVRQKKPASKDWPRTFVPSDKIDADSIVSFPADI